MQELVAAYNAARTDAQAYIIEQLLRAEGVLLVGAREGRDGATVGFRAAPDSWHEDKKALVVYRSGVNPGVYFTTMVWTGRRWEAEVVGVPRRLWPKPNPRLRAYCRARVDAILTGKEEL